MQLLFKAWSKSILLNIIYQRGVNYMGPKIFNILPPYIKDMSNNVRKFEICLKQFLHIHSFYSIEEYFQYKAIIS